MAYEIKYRTEFTDIHGLDWRVDILEDNFAGSVTNLTATGDPLNIFLDNEDDSVFDPIRETHAEISVYSDTDFALQDLYSIELLQFKVNIYAGEDLFWSGWIEPQKYEEVYEPVSYPVTISATCGLSELKNIEFKDTELYYEGRKYESQVVLDILGKIGFTTFNEYVNLYEDSMDSTVDDSPFDQTLIDVDIFRESSCYDVLNEILKKYRSFIRQKDGVFCIVRPKELIGATVYGRNFTAYDTKTSITITPQQYINRTGYTSNRWQVPGGTLMIQAPYKKVLFTHDYGSLYSWIKNYNFDSDTTTGLTLTGLSFENWSIHGAPNVSPAGNAIISENQGVIIPYKADPANNYIYQIFGHTAKTSATDMFYFGFDYLLYNSGSTTAFDIDIRIQIYDYSGASYFLTEDDELTCSWSGSGQISVINDAGVGSSGWTSWSRAITGLPADGPYIIKIFPAYNSNEYVSIGIRNLRFFTSSSEIVRTTTTYKVEKKIKFSMVSDSPFEQNRRGWTKSVKFIETLNKDYEAENSGIGGKPVSDQFFLGDVVDANIDNVPEQFEGSLAVGALTLLNRVDEVILTTDTGAGQALITCNGYSETAIWNTSLAQTALDFISNHNSEFPGVNVSSGGDGIIRFTQATAGVDFIGETTIENTIFDLWGYVSKTQPSLSSSIISATESWSTRGGTENKTIIQLIADETVAMYDRPKQLIQMPIYEIAETLSLNTLGNLQDALNTYSGAMRIFCINRGSFNVRDRVWDIDLFEIGTGAVPEGGVSATADSTLVTADSTLITTDSTI